LIAPRGRRACPVAGKAATLRTKIADSVWDIRRSTTRGGNIIATVIFRFCPGPPRTVVGRWCRQRQKGRIIGVMRSQDPPGGCRCPCPRWSNTVSALTSTFGARILWRGSPSMVPPSWAAMVLAVADDENGKLRKRRLKPERAATLLWHRFGPGEDNPPGFIARNAAPLPGTGTIRSRRPPRATDARSKWTVDLAAGNRRSESCHAPRHRGRRLDGEWGAGA